MSVFAIVAIILGVLVGSVVIGLLFGATFTWAQYKTEDLMKRAEWRRYEKAQAKRIAEMTPEERSGYERRTKSLATAAAFAAMGEKIRRSF